MTIRVDVSRLPADVAEALERGDPLEFERDGKVVRRLSEEKPPFDWAAYIAERKRILPWTTTTSRQTLRGSAGK